MYEPVSLEEYRIFKIIATTHMGRPLDEAVAASDTCPPPEADGSWGQLVSTLELIIQLADGEGGVRMLVHPDPDNVVELDWSWPPVGLQEKLGEVLETTE